MIKYGPQGTTCLEAGAYLLNFKACVQCGVKDVPVNSEKTTAEDEDGVETITFNREG